MDPLVVDSDASVTLEQQLLEPNEEWAMKTDPRQKITRTQAPQESKPSAFTSVMEQGA
jgi:hypothetical protein